MLAAILLTVFSVRQQIGHDTWKVIERDRATERHDTACTVDDQKGYVLPVQWATWVFNG